MKKKRFLGILLTLVMLLGLMTGMSLTAYADNQKAYAAYDVTTETNKTKSGNDLTALQVTFNERQWYIIEDNSSSATSGTVTLLSADTTFGTKTFDDVNNSNKYSTSQVKTYLDSMTGTGGAFAGVAEAIETVNLTTNHYNSNHVYETVNNVKLYLLSTEEAKSLPENVLKAEFTGGDCNYNQWWLRSPGYHGDYAACVFGAFCYVEDGGGLLYLTLGVRPALKLNLSSVIFSSESKTFSLKLTEYEVTYKVVNGTWSDGSTTDKKETVAEGSKPASVPTGMKASDGYTGGSWDTNPANTTITGAKTFTYTFTAKQTESPQSQTEASAPAAQAERIIIPKTPAKVKAKSKKNSITVSWNKIKKNKKTKALRAMIKNVEVQYSTDPTFPKEATVTRIIKKNKTKLVLRGLQRKTVYYVRVRYVGADGVSNWKTKHVRTK